jgi:hypothetical protein
MVRVPDMNDLDWLIIREALSYVADERLVDLYNFRPMEFETLTEAETFRTDVKLLHDRILAAQQPQ